MVRKSEVRKSEVCVVKKLVAKLLFNLEVILLGILNINAYHRTSDT